MQSPSRSTLPIVFPYTVHFFAANTLLRFGGDGTWWRRTIVRTSALNKQKKTCAPSVLFLFHKVWEFRYLYWVPFCCEQITSQQKRSTMKKKQQKTTKKLNRSNAYHAPLSPVKCLWSSRLRSSSRITLSSNAAAASTVAFGSKPSSYGIKAVPLPSKISFCSTVLNQICLSKKWTKNTEQTTPQ